MESLFQNILTSSVYGSFVIVAILLLRPVLKKAPKKFLCFLWLLAFLRLLLPFHIESRLSLQPQVPSISQAWEQPDALTAPMPTISEIPQVSTPTAMAPMPDAADIPASPQIPTAPEKSHHTTGMMAILSWIWLGVAGLFLIYSVYSYLRLRILVQDAIRIKGAWESERIETAFILGFFRPRIYIPMGMSQQTRRYILAHERTHLKKGDHWLKLFGYLTLAIHWFNPLVWLAYIMLCKDIELACDERVVQSMNLAERKAYSAALIACSANRTHLGACPVAFGEISVKERIKSVLRYKKPAFWLSLIGVIVIVFVVVCLMTTPAKVLDHTEHPELAASEGPFADLSVSEIQATCEQALQALKNRDSYYLFEEVHVEGDDPQMEPFSSNAEYRRFGNNLMELTSPRNEKSLPIGWLECGDRKADFNGSSWILNTEIPSQDPNRILSFYGPQEKTISFPEGTGVLDGNTLSFQVVWSQPTNSPSPTYEGIFIYHFLDDGTLKKIERNYHYYDGDHQEIRNQSSLTVMEEDAQTTQAVIQTAADSAITKEEANRLRVKQNQVSEIPSNKTHYDQDFMLGAGEMGWQFQDGQWFLKFGAHNATETSADLHFEYAEAYDQSGVTGTAVTDDTFYLETLQDGLWVKYPLKHQGKNTLQSQKISVGSTVHLDWGDSYGALPGGFYRIGMYYTLTTSGGNTEKQFCYAKFRLYDPEFAEKIEQCRNGLNHLLNQDSYHITMRDRNAILTWGNEEPWYIIEDTWKSGDTYLSQRVQYRHADDSILSWGGCMLQDGIGYVLEYESNDFSRLIRKEPAGNINLDLMHIWTIYFEIYDALVTDIIEEGQTIRILTSSSADDCYKRSEIIFCFDDDGDLSKIQNVYIDHEDQSHLDVELIIHGTAPEQIQEMIQSQTVA